MLAMFFSVIDQELATRTTPSIAYLDLVCQDVYDPATASIVAPQRQGPG